MKVSGRLNMLKTSVQSAAEVQRLLQIYAANRPPTFYRPFDVVLIAVELRK